MNNRKCPRCGLIIHQLSGDRFLKCHRCGWTAGWPVVRWLTHPSWMRHYLYRIRRPAESRFGRAIRLAVILAGVLILAAAVGPVINSAGDGSINVPSWGGSTDTSLDIGEAERKTFGLTNEKRLENGVPAVQHSGPLSAIARRHSQDMAQNDYIGHTEPDGDTVSDRLDQEPNDCGGYGTKGFTHGENAGGTFWRTDVGVFGSGETVRINDETDVARVLVAGWMNSAGHRRNMLYSEWDRVGIGIAINTSTDQIYATQLFC